MRPAFLAFEPRVLVQTTTPAVPWDFAVPIVRMATRTVTVVSDLNPRALRPKRFKTRPYRGGSWVTLGDPTTPGGLRQWLIWRTGDPRP